MSVPHLLESGNAYLIGKIIADFSGLTEKLSGQKNGKFEKINTINYQIAVQRKAWDKFQREVKAAKGDTVRIKTIIDNSKLKDLKKINGLYDYAVNQSQSGNNVHLHSVNDLIQTQNYKNIADQAYGLRGVNAAINEYKKLTNDASRTRLAETINNTNSSLGRIFDKFKRCKCWFV